MFVFTSCTNNYIPKARVLASTLKGYHPDWTFCLLLGETPPEGFDIDQEPFDRVVQFDELNIPNYHTWLFRHRVVEICTAAKGPALQYFLETEQHNKVIYLDPDIMVCNSLEPLEKLLDEYDILLTPHLLAPQPTDQAVRDNEQCALCHGVFNLGFMAAARRGQGLDFARWWCERLMWYCYDDIPNGLFTDQRWCDLAPAFFSKLFIIRDPGYNAASWNLTDRTITMRDDGIFMANNSFLRFYHFTGFDSGAGEYMTERYAKSMPAVGELWSIYKKRLLGFDHTKLGKQRWVFMFFDDGTPISDAMRLLYRERKDLQEAFPNPFLASGFLRWYRNEIIAPSVCASKILSRNHHKLTAIKGTIAQQLEKNGGGARALPRLLHKTINKIRKHGFCTVMRAIWHGSPVDGISSSKNSSSKTEDPLPQLLTILNNKQSCDELTDLLNIQPVCIIEHDWGGGADIYAQKRIAEFLAEGRAVVRLRYVIKTQQIELSACLGEKKIRASVASIHDLSDRRFPNLSDIVINELAGWYFCLDPINPSMLEKIQETISDILDIKKLHNARLEFVFHDFFAICPSINLLKSSLQFCGIPSLQECSDGAQCHGQGCIRGKFFMIDWRSAWSNLLIHCDQITFFSENTLNLAKSVYSFREEQIAIRPHTVKSFNKKLTIPSDGPMRIAVVGDIHPHKGANIVSELGKLLKENVPESSIIVFGNLHTDVIPDTIKILGPYKREELPKLLEKYEVTVGFIPSICPETFSFVTHELASLGLPLVSFALGAPGDFIKKLKYGRVAKEINASSALDYLQQLDSLRRS